MDKTEIAQIASDFIDSSNHGKFIYHYEGEHKSDLSHNEWVVRYRVESKDGAMFDSPVLVLVNEDTKIARFYRDR